MLLESNLFDNGLFCPLYSQTWWLDEKSRIIKQLKVLAKLRKKACAVFGDTAAWTLFLNIKFPNVRSGPVPQCKVHGVLITADNEPFLQRNPDANYASAREA